MVTPHFAYLFMIWWMFRRFHSLATVSHAATGIHGDIFVEIPVFSYLDFIPRSGIARSHNSIEVLRKCHSFPNQLCWFPFLSAGFTEGSSLSRLSPRESLPPRRRSHLRPSSRTRGGHHTALLGCVVPATKDAEHFGSCAFWPTVYLFLWRNGYSNSLLILKLSCLYFCCWVLRIIYIFWAPDPYQTNDFCIFSPILWAVFPLS